MEDQYKNDNKEVKKLLKKLQETFLSPSSTDAGNQKEDANDRKFREQLAKMLKLDMDSSSAGASSVQKPRAEKKPKPPKQDKPTNALSEESPTELFLDEPVQVEEPAPEPISDEPIELAVNETLDEPTQQETLPDASIESNLDEPLDIPVEDSVEPKPLPSPPKKPRRKLIPKQPKAVEPIVAVEPIKEEPIEEKTIEAIEAIENPDAPEADALRNPLDWIVPLESASEHTAPEPIDATEPVEPEPIEDAESIAEAAQVADERPPITVFIPEKREPIYTEVADQLAIPVDDYLPQAADQPIVIRPTMRHPKEQQRVQSDGIVIRPTAPKDEQEDIIVIAPGSIKRIPHQKQDLRRQIAEKPIKIGKEILPADQRKEIPDPAKQPKPIMKKEQNTTLVPPTTSPEATPKSTTRVIAKGPATPHRKPGVTMPRTAEKNDTGSDGGSEPPRQEAKIKSVQKKSTTPPRPAVRKTKSVKKNSEPHPIEPMLNDDDTEEVLEETVIEEIPFDAPDEKATTRSNRSISERKLTEKRKREEDALSPMELVCKRSGLTEDDIIMMLELGYENELGRLVGFEVLKRIKSDRMKTVNKHESKQYRTAFGYRGEEFADLTQRDTIRAAYVRDRKKLILRTVLTALATLLLLFLATPELLGAQAIALNNRFPFLFPLLSLALLIGAAALSYKQINAGLRSLLHFSPTPYTVAAVLLPIAVIYDLAALFAKSDMFGVDLPIAAILLLTAICDVLRLSNEMRTFRIVSAEGEKNVLDAATPRKKKLRRGNKIVKIINDDLGENLYRVRKAEQCVGFFRRFNAMQSAVLPFTLFLATSFSLSVISAFITAVVTDSLSITLSAFMVVLLTSAPISALFAYFFPLCRANRLLYKHNCALVGEESVTEYDQNKTLIFDDSDLYSAKTQAEVSVEDGDILRHDLRLAGILFRKLGGALESVGVKLSGGQADPPVSILRIRENGVEAMVDNSRHMLIGSAEFMQRGGIRVPKESTDRILRRTANVSLMYVAVDGVLKLGYEIEYQTEKSFEDLISELADANTSVAIRSYDPNLNDTFLHKSRPDGIAPVQVIRPGRFEEDKPVEISDTGAVALGNKKDLAAVLHASAGIGRLHRFFWRMQLIATVLSAVSVTALTVMGHLSAITFSAIAAYHAFWVLVSIIATYSELSTAKLKFKK